jgi:hypothetical protein
MAKYRNVCPPQARLPGGLTRRHNYQEKIFAVFEDRPAWKNWWDCQSDTCKQSIKLELCQVVEEIFKEELNRLNTISGD